MLEILIPTCERDLGQVQLLLSSLDRYLAPEAVDSLDLAWIDGSTRVTDFRALDTGTFQSRTRYLTLEDLSVKRNGAADGWSRQQIAKLLFARQVRTEFYMVLDSKNLALRPVGPDDLVRDGRAAWVLEPISPRKSTWWRGSAWALRHPRFDRSPSRLAVSSATPFLFHTESVNRMIDWLERRHRSSFQRFFERRRPVIGRYFTPTEFTLYYVFLDRERTADRYHFVSDQLHDRESQIWRTASAEQRRERLERILHSETTGKFTGIQHSVWPILSDAERSALRARVEPPAPDAATTTPRSRGAPAP